MLNANVKVGHQRKDHIQWAALSIYAITKLPYPDELCGCLPWVNAFLAWCPNSVFNVVQAFSIIVESSWTFVWSSTFHNSFADGQIVLDTYERVLIFSCGDEFE